MNLQLVIEEAVCTGCGVCVDSCPTDVIRTRADGKAYAAYLEDCQACFLCVIDCPVDAIDIKQAKAPVESLGPRPLSAVKGN
jgi:NAD-dependent dihydropyrimidine dehydrogenase PreA subunit